MPGEFPHRFPLSQRRPVVGSGRFSAAAASAAALAVISLALASWNPIRPAISFVLFLFLPTVRFACNEAEPERSPKFDPFRRFAVVGDEKRIPRTVSVHVGRPASVQIEVQP